MKIKTVKKIDYADARLMIRPCDTIALQGGGPVSRLIRLFDRSPVSHVGVVAKMYDAISGTDVLSIIESTSLETGGDVKIRGVQVNRLSERIMSARRAWWFPVISNLLDNDERKEMLRWLYRQNGTEYDTTQAILSPLNIFGGRESYRRLFCSELVAAAYKHVGLLQAINPSATSPRELLRQPIFMPPLEIV